MRRFIVFLALALLVVFALSLFSAPAEAGPFGLFGNDRHYSQPVQHVQPTVDPQKFVETAAPTPAINREVFCRPPQQPEYVEPPKFEFPSEPSLPDLPAVTPEVVAPESTVDGKQVSVVAILAGLAGLVAGYIKNRDEEEVVELEDKPNADAVKVE